MLESFHSMPSDEESPRNNHCCERWNTDFPTEDSVTDLQTKETFNHHNYLVREVLTLGFARLTLFGTL